MRILSIVFLILVLFLLTEVNNSQEFYAGFIGGVNFSDMEFMDDGINRAVNSQLKFGAGAVMGYRLNRTVSVQFEPAYLQKGGSVAQKTQYSELTIHSSYLEMPILLNVILGKENWSYRFTMFTGPSFGLILSSSGELQKDNKIYKGSIRNISDTIDIGYVFGGGISVPFGNGSAFISGRYCLGLTNNNIGGSMILTSGRDVINEYVEKYDEMSTRGFQILMGYTFSFGGK